MADRGIDVDVYVTERPGHARDLAAAALMRGCDTVIAWGGDGTVNEVGGSVAFRDATLGIVAGGSGNGLARELDLPLDPARALEIAVSGVERRIDAGEMAGRLFFNVAGIGLDARVAHRFARDGGRRGLARYATATLRELFTGEPDDYRVTTDGRVLEARALLIAIANTRQYGNGAKIAPAARIDDGRLDVVVIGARSPVRTLLAMPRLFTGGVARVSGVSSCAAAGVEIVTSRPMLFHVDGEPLSGGTQLTAQCHPGALRVAARRAG
jgi:YegS/Rv2252/BmrU family lipid kinase